MATRTHTADAPHDTARARALAARSARRGVRPEAARSARSARSAQSAQSAQSVSASGSRVTLRGLRRSTVRRTRHDTPPEVTIHIGASTVRARCRARMCMCLRGAVRVDSWAECACSSHRGKDCRSRARPGGPAVSCVLSRTHSHRPLHDSVTTVKSQSITNQSTERYDTARDSTVL